MSDLDKYNDLINHQGKGGEDELSEFLRKSAKIEVPTRKNKDAIWDKIADSIEEGENKEKEKKSTPIWRYIGVAAAIALLAFFFLPDLKSNTASDDPIELISITTKIGESRTETLPDGSQVFLNASSSISYNQNWNREISLQGEAFFEVTKGEKFVVKTAFGNVQVLGTSFNVFARDGNLDVACKTGKVNVSVPKRAISEDLTPGKAITVKTDTVKVVFRVPEAIGTWKSGEFYFEKKPISEVFEEFERQFSIEIDQELENEDQFLFTGYFRNDKDLEGALESVCAVMGLQYQKTGQNKFTISKSSQ